MTETNPLIINAHPCEIDGESMKQILAFAPRKLAGNDSDITAEEQHDAAAGEIQVKLWRIVPEKGAGRRIAPALVSSHTFGPSFGVRPCCWWRSANVVRTLCPSPLGAPTAGSLS